MIYGTLKILGARSLKALRRKTTGSIVFLALAGSLPSTATMAAGDKPAPQIYAEKTPSVVAIQVVRKNGTHASGTGFVVARGVIATNYHIVQLFSRGNVVFGVTGRKYAIRRILALSAAADLALISAPTAGVPAIEPTGREAVAPGQRIFTIGNPAGLTNTFTEGMVSGIRGPADRRTIQISTFATTGHSGSPVFNRRGGLVAVIRSKARQGVALVFATPAAILHKLLQGAGAAAAAGEANFSARRAQRTDPAIDGEVLRAVLPRTAQYPTIRIGVPRWTTAEATGHVLKAMIEEKFFLRVELHRGTTAQIFKQMASRNGFFDIHPEIWLPNHRAVSKKYTGPEKPVRLNRNGYVGFQGFCIPGYVRDQYGVKHVDDLRRPAIARLFRPGPKKRGQVWLGDPNWRATNIRKLKARDYGFAPFFDLHTSDEDSFLAILQNKLERKEPVLFACYAPHWITSKYDLAVLKEPAYSRECYDVHDPARSPDWFERSKAGCKGPVPKIHVAYAARLERTVPQLARFLADLRLDHEAVSRWATAFDRMDLPPRATARILGDKYLDQGL